MKKIQLPLFHKIFPYTRLAYLVESATRPGIAHLVDFEGHEREKVVCTCEDFIYNRARPCAHIKSAALYL